MSNTDIERLLLFIAVVLAWFHGYFVGWRIGRTHYADELERFKRDLATDGDEPIIR